MKRPKRLVVEVSDEFHKAVKLHVCENEFQSVSSFMLFALQRALAYEREFSLADLKESRLEE